MTAEVAKVDPMHQFTIEPIFGSANWELAGYNIAFTNSAMWMLIATIVLWIFVAGGMRRELVPGRWQMSVEFFTGFIDDMLEANIGKEGRKYVPYIFSLFMFILFANILGLMPLGVIGIHPFGKSFFKPVAASVAGGVALLLWRLVPGTGTLIDAAGLVVGGIVYLVTLKVLGLDKEEEYVFRMIKKKAFKGRGKAGKASTPKEEQASKGQVDDE